ncbi:MAG: 6-hydroxymethylpterin diphosphokinase MptE-like protein, partial [Wujia sp.]
MNQYESDSMIDILKEKIYDCIVSRNTKILFSERWFTTTINNIADMTKATLIDEYTGMYKNKPAIIVSAGPSLDKNID